MKDDFQEFTYELRKTGFFGMLKLAAETVILGSRGVSNQHAFDRGLLHGKMSLFLKDGDNVIWISPIDIETFWTEGSGTDRKHFFRTKSGKDFEVEEESWFRIMYGNEYKRN